MCQAEHVTDGNLCHFSSNNLVQFVMFVVYNLDKNNHPETQDLYFSKYK